MATGGQKEEVGCNLVNVGTLTLETTARKPFYTGLVTSTDTLMVVELNAMNLQLYSRHDGKLLATSERLESRPYGVCLISNTLVGVILYNSKIVILSLKSLDDAKRVKTLDLTTVFDSCHAVAKVKSTGKLVVSGWKQDMTCWCVVSLTDGHVETIHTICKRGLGSSRSHLAIKNHTVYISCPSDDSTVRGVYAYDIFNPLTHKFLYQHSELYRPYGLTVDTRGCIFVCNWNSNSIHQLTDRGELVTIHRVSSEPFEIFYEDQHGVLYTTSYKSNVIARYRLEYLHQPGIPIEILNMDDRSIQLFEEALKDGKETVCSIRVMVVGHMGVGKTTLIKRLLGEEVNISERLSTEGIDVYISCCDVSLSTSEWTRRMKDSEQDYQLQRLARVLNEQQSARNKVADDKEVVIPPQGEKNDSNASVTDKEHVVIQNKDIEVLYLRSPQQDFGQVLSSTVSQQTESPTTLVHQKLTQSETNTMALLKLLQEHAYKLPQDAGKNSPLTMWDFAGHFAFYTTHQTFLTRRAIYLLVSDVSEQLTDFVADECYFDTEGIMKCRVHELIEVWLNSIHSCAPSPEAGIPPVILVGTHVDKILQRCHHEICERYFRDIRTCLKDKPTRFHLVDEDFAIDNTIVDSKLEDLKRKIVEVASQQPYWEEKIPTRWIPLEQELMRLKAAGIKVIPWSLLEDLNKAGAVQIATDELDLFLRFQHEIGTILYFSMELLKKKIVLDPQWMIDALKSLITAEMFVLRSIPAVTDKWFEFKDKGKLSRELVDAVWTKQKHPDLHDNKEHILLLMEQLNIIAKLRLYSEDALEIKEENYFLAPCMLRQKTPREVIFPVPHDQMESSSVLCYVFKGKFLPSPIFHRLLAACVAHWPIATKKKENILENLIFCGCCVFQLDHYHKLTLHFRDYIIFMRITRMGMTDKTPSSKLCIEVREFVTAMLIKIIGYLGQSLKFEHFIQCPEYTGDSINSLIPVSLLKEHAEVCCDFHDNMIESYNLLKFWFQNVVSMCITSSRDLPKAKVFQIVFSTKCKPGDTISTFSIDSSTSGDSKENVYIAAGDTRRQLSEHIAAPKSTVERKMDSVAEIHSRVSDEEYQMSLQRRALPPGKKYHAFFSYSSSDIQWVRNTVERLEKDHGFVCREYDRDNTPGTPLLEFADDSIRNAYKTVVVMTKEAFQSGFVLHEIQMAMSQGFNEGRNCVVPILLEDCEVPSYLSVLNYVDARDTTRRDIWWPKLVLELENQGQRGQSPAATGHEEERLISV